MNNQKWNSVLIEWVNCLKLCKNINSPDELRSGEFFSNLQKVITKSWTAQTDSLTFIFDLLGNHYPHYSFDNKTEIHLNDLPELDLKAMISLLMHYTCIYDRKDVLTSPLCHALSQSTQLIVRNFLQKITKDVTKESMNNIIKICIDDASGNHSTKHQWLSVEGSSRNSPLQDLLKTPVSKSGRLHEKDRIIAKLKSELETERYDRAEVQQDLHLQVEKNKKIEQQISQKNNEIARLRGEVASLENRTPPHYQDMDSRELQRRLRSEIQSLEQYIKQIEVEQDEIRKERDSANEQLRKLESKSSIWEEKFFETESNFETLREHSRKQEMELVQLQEHCTEITGLLEEYRSKSSNDSSLYDTFVAVSDGKCLTATNSCEDLACSVIEVQLRDAQKQNEELKLKIEQGEKMKVRLMDTAEQLKKSEKSNEDLVIKVKSLETLKENIEKRFSEVERNLHDAEQTIQEKTTRIEDLIENSKENSESLKNLSKHNEELAAKAASLQSLNERLEKRLNETFDDLRVERNRSETLENELNNIKTVSEKLQFELADVVVYNQDLDSRIEALNSEKESLLKYVAEADKTRGILETHLCESRQYSESWKFKHDVLQREYGHLDEEYRSNRIQLQQEKSELSSKLQESAEKLATVETTNHELKSQITTLQNQLSDVTNSVMTERKRTKQLEDEHVVLERQLSEGQKSSEQLAIAYEEIQSEKQKLAELLDENKACLESSERETSNLMLRLNHSEESRAILTKNGDEMLSKNQELEMQLLNTADNLETHKEIIEKLSENRNSLETQLSGARDVSEALEKELGKFRHEYQKVREELEGVEKRLKCSQDSCNNLEKQNNKLNLFVENLKKQSVGMQEELNFAKQDLQNSREVCDALEIRLNEEQDITTLLRDTIQRIDVEKVKIMEELGANQEEFGKIKQEKSVLELELETSKAECLSLEKEVVRLCQKLKDASEELQRTKKESDELRNTNAELKSHLEEVQEAAENLKCEIEEVRVQFTCNVAEYARLRSDKTAVEKQLEELNTVKNNLEIDLLKVIEDKGKLQQENCSLNDKLEKVELHKRELEEGSVEMLTKIRTLEARKEELISTITNLQKQHCEDQETIDGRNHAHEMLRQKLNHLHASIELLQLDKLKLNEDLMNATNEKQDAQDENVSLKTLSENLKCEIAQALVQLTRKVAESVRLENEKAAAEKQLEELNMVNKNLEAELIKGTELRENLQQENNSLSDNLEEVERYSKKIEEEKIEMLAKIQTMEAGSEELTSSIINLQKQHHKYQVTIDENNHAQEILEQKLEYLQALIEELQLDKLKLNEDLMNVTNENQILFAKYEETINDLELIKNHLKKAQDENTSLKTLSENLKCKIEQNQVQYTRNVAETVRLENDKVVAEKQLEELNNVKNNFEAELIKVTEERKKLQQENSSLSNKLKEIEMHARELEQENIAMVTKIQTLETGSEKLTSTVTNLQKQHGEDQQTIDDRNHAQEILERKLQQLHASVDELQLDTLRLNEDLMNAKHENQILFTSKEETLSNLELIKNHLKEAQEENISLKTLSEKLKCEVEQNQVQYTRNVAESVRLESEKVVAEKQREELNTVKNNLEATLIKVSEEREELQQENRSLIDNLEKVERELDEKKIEMLSKIQTLEAGNEELTSTVKNLQKQHCEDQVTINDGIMLEQKLKQLHASIEELQLDKLKRDEDLTNAKNENQTLLAKLKDSEIKLVGIEEQWADLVKAKSKLESEKVELLEKFTELRAQLNDVELTKQVVLAQTVEYEKQKVVYEKMSLDNDAVQKEKELLMLKLTESQEKEKNNNDLIKNLQEQVEEVVLENAKLEDCLEKAEEMKTQNRDLIVRNEDLQKHVSEIAQEKQELDAQLVGYSKKIDDLQVQNNNLQSQLCVLETDYKQMKNNKETIERQLNEVSVLSQTLTAESEDVRVQYHTSKIELSETKDALAKLKKEKDDLGRTVQETNDELRQDLELIKDEVEETKQEKTKVEHENKMLIATNEVLEKRLFDTEKIIEEKQVEINRFIVDYKVEVENITKRAEKAEQNLKDATQELLTLQKKMEQVAHKNSILNKKIEVEEIISSETKERAKCLEETIQDYEITISGLKSVVDSNLERLESLKEEVNEKKCTEMETIKLVAGLFENSNIKYVQHDDFKSFIYENFSQILKAKKEAERRRQDLETEIRELKENIVAAQGLNSSVQGMIEKLQVLVTESGEVGSIETLKSCFDNIHIKVTNLVQAKQELSESLRKIEDDKSELSKQFETLKIEKEEIAKAKAEADQNLKTEREKIESLMKELEHKVKPVKMEKENILGVSTKMNKSREEELKKENMMLKRKVVLAENAKNNLERVLKELREQKKTASLTPSSTTNEDVLYKKLLQEYIQVKEDNERAVKEKDAKIKELCCQNEKLKLKNINPKTEDDKRVVHDLQNIREAYGNLMSVNSKLELEMTTLRKIIEERNSDMANMAHIKEAYERLLEDNNKVLTEIDTVKYKRMRDKEEFVRLLKKDREEAINRETRKIQQVRGEYEAKLEKMKEKMLRLYRDEVNKKVKSVKDGHNETTQLMKTVANLKSDLFEADQKVQLLEMEREILKANRRLNEARTLPMPSTSSITSLTSNDDRSTLPRSSTARDLVSQTSPIGRLAPDTISTHNLQMEDEEDLFNDKYLTDLKEGRCALPVGRDSTCRFSELAWRNSMVPPHLKSSYPAEMQFISPGRFKDDDIKTGNIEFEDSLCKLLSGEKPRKKDFGTTSYKRPGPPTPSKNGGRLSLQGNEIHPMREHCEAKTPKKSTPSRIRALFTGRNSSTRDASESQNNGTPSRGRRLNIFRRPR